MPAEKLEQCLLVWQKEDEKWQPGCKHMAR
jgi:hypothetical protein